MTTTNENTVNVQVDELFDNNLLTTDFNTQASFNAEFNRIFGTSQQFENIRQQCVADDKFITLKQGATIQNIDSIGETEDVKGNGILRLNWLTETQTIDELDEIDDIDDIDELDDLDLDLLYELDTDITINKEEFKELLQASEIRISDELVDKIFAFFDKDENETLDYNEVSQFIKYIEQRRLSKVKSRSQKVKNVVNIDSRYQKDYYNNISTSFDYNLPEPQLDVTSVRLGNVDIPMTQYNVSSKLKNNSFLIISNANTVKVESDISSHWRLKMQIGDISSDWLHGSVFEDYSYTSTDIIKYNSFANEVIPQHNSFWHGPETSTTNVYDTSIVPIETVTFEVSNYSFDGESDNIQTEDDVSGTMVDFYADPSNNICGLGNPATTRCLFPRSRTVPLEEQSIQYYVQPPRENYWGDPWGAYSAHDITIDGTTLNKGDPYPINPNGDISWGWFRRNKSDDDATTSSHRTYDSNHPNPSRSNPLPEYGIEHQQLIFPDPSNVPFGHVPYRKSCTNRIQLSNHVRTTTKTTTYLKEYSFLKLTYQQWQANGGIWNGQDGNTYSDTIDANTNPFFSKSGNNATIASRKWLLHTEINYKGLVKNQTPYKPINVWFPRGNPNRTDISFENVTYYNGDPVEYPYDCSGIHETTSNTTKTKDIHIRSYTFVRLSDGKEMSSDEFMPVKFAWLVKVPDGNYDESWSNLNRNERIINDAIRLATPGAVDVSGKFAAIKSPEHYFYLNHDKFIKNRKFTSSHNINSSLRVSGISISDIRYNVDRITKKSVFASETSYLDSSGSIVDIDTMITSNFKFLARTGQSSLRTVVDEFKPNTVTAPLGEQYTEMILMQNVAKQPVSKLTSLPNKLLSSIKFNVDEFGNQDNETNIQHKLGWVLGFRAAEYLM
jgi:hypothetical protein